MFADPYFKEFRNQLKLRKTITYIWLASPLPNGLNESPMYHSPVRNGKRMSGTFHQEWINPLQELVYTVQPIIIWHSTQLYWNMYVFGAIFTFIAIP